MSQGRRLFLDAYRQEMFCLVRKILALNILLTFSERAARRMKRLQRLLVLCHTATESDAERDWSFLLTPELTSRMAIWARKEADVIWIDQKSGHLSLKCSRCWDYWSHTGKNPQHKPPRLPMSYTGRCLICGGALRGAPAG